MIRDSHSILQKWRNHFSQLLNVCGVNDVRQTETHTADLLVSEPSASDVEMATKKLRRHKSRGTAEVPAELVKGREMGQLVLRSQIPKVTIKYAAHLLRIRKVPSCNLGQHNAYPEVPPTSPK